MNATRLITVLVVDDHAAVRAGVKTLIDAEPGLAAVDAVGDAFAVAPAVHSLRPDVVVMDYQLPEMDGLSACRQITRSPVAPAVLVYSPFAGREMIVPAHIAHARAVADKALEPRELTLMVRKLAAGEDLLPPADPSLVAAAGHRIALEDRPNLGMLIEKMSLVDIASAQDLAVEAVERRIDHLLARLVVSSRPT